MVFAAGDNADGGPNTVQNGHRQADCIAENIQREMKGEALAPFKIRPNGLLISIGPTYGFTDTKIPLRGYLAVVLKFSGPVSYPVHCRPGANDPLF